MPLRSTLKTVIKKLLRVALLASLGIGAVGAYGFYNYTSIIKEELISQNSGRSFAILECDQGLCDSGTYIDLSTLDGDVGTPHISILKAANLTAISSALVRSNIPYKFSGRIALYEVGTCNHILRDAPETFHALHFAKIEKARPAPESTTCEEVYSAGPCQMRVRVLSVQTDRPRFQIVSTINNLSYLGSGLLWAWL